MIGLIFTVLIIVFFFAGVLVGKDSRNVSDYNEGYRVGRYEELNLNGKRMIDAAEMAIEQWKKDVIIYKGEANLDRDYSRNSIALSVRVDLAKH